MELEYVVPGIEAHSTLNYEQMNAFFNQMENSVLQITVQRIKGRNEISSESLTGVCITFDGLILTRYFNDNGVSSIFARDANETTNAELVFHNREVGLALLHVRRKVIYHVKFGEQTEFDAGQHVYTIIRPGPREGLSPIFLMGHLAYQYCPNDPSANNVCSEYRRVRDSPVDVRPYGLGEEVPLLQIARLLDSDESPNRKNCEFKNKFGFREGRGGPLFNANGHLIGLIAFQHGGFDFAITVDEIKKFVFARVPSHGQGSSGKRKHEKEEKGKGFLSY